VFFHFHSLKFFDDDMVLLTDPGYDLDENAIELVFKPYVRKLNSAKDDILKRDGSFDPNGSGGPSPYGEMGLATILKYYTDGMKRSKKNVFGNKLISKIRNHYFFKASTV
jgi:hypothetical protein